MNKRRAHHIWRKLRFIKPRYLLALAIISSLVCLFALRANNEHMVQLRHQVYAADQNNTDIQGALQKLQAYVTAHMNTNLADGQGSVYPPIQLKYTYERLQQAQSDNLAQTNTQLYTQAQHYCEQQNPNGFSGRYRVPCIEQYVQTHSPQSLPKIPDALYKFDFISPSWSPDLAGWSMVVAILSWLLFVIMLLVHWQLRHTD